MEALLMQTPPLSNPTLTAPTSGATGAEGVISDLARAWLDEEDTLNLGGAIVRTARANLVMFSADTETAAQAEDTLPGLVWQHPCRAIHIVKEEEADAPLQATSQLHTRSEGSRRIIACEQVTLRVGLTQMASLEGVVEPLLHPDLPVCLWWRGNPPFDGTLFERLVEAADRIIYDSQCFLEPEEDLPWIHDMVTRSARFGVSASDVNWARLTPWRLLVAQFFDGPAQVGALDGISRVEIEFVDRHVTFGHVPLQAWLLLGWLATRLHWKAREQAPALVDHEARFQLWQGDTPVDVVLRQRIAASERDATRTSSHPDGIVAVEIATTLPCAGQYRVERLDDANCVRAVRAQENTQPVEAVVEMPPEPDADLIAQEMDRPGRDQVYEEVLAYCTPLVPLVHNALIPVSGGESTDLARA